MRFTICGSARFEPLWHEWNKRLGLMGHHSYALMTYPSIEGSKSWYTDSQKELLDLLHLAKIEDSDAIFVLNKDRYVGDSTRREVAWAKLREKRVYWLEANYDYDSRENFTFVHLPGWRDYVARYGIPND